MATVLFAPQTSGGAAIFAPQVINTFQLEALEPSVIQRYTISGSLRLVLNFIDTPAPPERTIVLGGRSRTITSG